MKVHVREICNWLEMQRDSALHTAGRGRLTSFSVEYKTDEAPKPCLPDSIDHPIAVMPLSRMQNTTLAMPLIEDLS
ncbi:hypothetical protein TNCV_4836291 [Trichonephila clavipes]|nr:hypothetical protein TNCV_4836291 [Trichonephila clavipes]